MNGKDGEKGNVTAKVNDSDGSSKGSGLRRQAEELLRASKRDVESMSFKDVQQLVQELQVHQIELEMQNEELRRVQVELETARDRYVDLYDWSPAGHLTLDPQGKIVEANLRAGSLLGMHRNKLIGRPLASFLEATEQDRFHRHCREVMKTGLRQTCELQLRQHKGAFTCVNLESLAVRDEQGGVRQWRTALLDISAHKRVERELETQRAQREAIIDSAMDAIITVDEEQRVVLFNRAAEAMFLCGAGEAIGRPLEQFIPERFRRAHHDHLQRFGQSSMQPRAMQRSGTLYGRRSDGEEFPFEASIAHVRVNDTQLFTVILRDITERKAVESALRASEAFTRAVLDSLVTQVCVLDEQGVILNTNEAWKQGAVCTSDGAVIGAEGGQNYLDQCRREIAGGSQAARVVLEGIETVLAGRQPSFSMEYSCPAPEGERDCWFHLRVARLRGAGGVVLSRTDISERVQMARELEDHVVLLGKQRMELESLAGKLIGAQEQERLRIARELHDDFNQRLAALSLELESLERSPTVPSMSMVRQLAIIRGQVDRLSDDLHELAYKLHPSLLEHVGLEVAIQDHAAEFEKRTGLPVMFEAREVPEKLPPEVATNLFRVMQESLQNVSKHAQPTEVTVKLSGSSKGVGLSVRDNGTGFDIEDRQTRVRGLGLLSMQERVRLLGGFLRIHSKLGSGTKVCAWIPRSQDRA
ncbi:MAG TPA: PAS domain S-box protein [Nitrospira sp.]|nr:PAS domain S-box protein [Candidatus Nomurabacteria bacterium]HNP80356.1 PAS domain S-box protein [Nitrospira sp.]